MNKNLIPLKNYHNSLINAFALTAVLLSAPAALAQTTLAKWTFETSQPGVVTLPAAPGAGVWLTNIVAEVGSGVASGLHAGAATYSAPAGNGSARSFSSQTWGVGDVYQFAVSTVGYQGIVVSFDQAGSGTGPGQFNLLYSTDGVNFTQFGPTYTVLTSTSPNAWNATTPYPIFTHTFDLGSIGALNNTSVVYFRLVDASTVSTSGGTVGTSGTCRIDNFAVTGFVPGPPTFATDLPNTTSSFFGDTLTLSVVVNGSPTLYYQWYYPNLSTPLNDGNSGYGVGTISGTTNQTLTMTFVNPAQAGNYQVIVANSLDSATSQVAVVTINTRPTLVTNINYLHTLLDANYALTDFTNIYQSTGTVTTAANLVSGTSVYSYHIQDGTGGIDVFHRGGFSPNLPNAGDVVRVTSPLLQFNGLLEMSPVSGNPTHNLEVLSAGNPLPEPLLFDFTTINPVVMESTYEGRYVIVSNVFLGMTNTSVILSGGNVFMTNLNGQVFRLFNPAPAIDPQGLTPPAFARSVRGVMTQGDGTSPFDSAYSMFLLLFSDIEAGTAPPPPEPLSIQLVGTDVVLTWNNSDFNLQAAPAATGTYTNILAATSPYPTPISSVPRYFRLAYPLP